MKKNPKTPTLYEWAGGIEAIEKMITHFYEQVVEDDTLSPIFQGMSRKHQLHVAHFIAEVFGGGPKYTENGGSHYGMVKKHFGKHLNETHRKQFIKLLLESADQVGMPSDPEFRSAFVGYLEWGTRLAVINSNEETIEMNKDEPMPQWGWGEVGGPYLPNE